MEINGKNISIIGAMRSGVAAAKLARKFNAMPFVSDLSSEEKLSQSYQTLTRENIAFEVGGHTEKIYDCDLMIISPAVPSNSEVVSEAVKRKIKVVSELEFASWFCRGKIIAITGTNGKTTTTALLNHTINISGFKCYSGGNIGNAFSEFVLDVKENEFVALEVSSFQLDHIYSFKPAYSVILNITPDHLDRYENNFQNYIDSKMRVCMNQNGKDYFVYNGDDENVSSGQITNTNKFEFSLSNQTSRGSFVADNHFYFSNEDKTEKLFDLDNLSLRGEHNICNALAVLTVSKLIGCRTEKIKEAFKSFPGVEHRLEFVREINGIVFINDSKATNVDSVWYALRSFNQPILLILGGKDKGNDYNRIKDLVFNKVKKIYAIGTSAQKIYEFFKDIVPVEYKQSLGECVEDALKTGTKGGIVLLSPACASFDMFDNFEHRGRVFKESVMGLNL